MKTKNKKVIFGSFIILIIISLLTTNLFIYTLFLKVEQNNQELKKQINNLQRETHSKMNELTKNILELSTGQEFFAQELIELKAVAGEDFSGIVEQAVKAVVTIRTDISQGTGFIIDNKGFIVTNAHVIEEAEKIEAIDYNQNIIHAFLIGYNKDFDLALLKINGTFNKLELANSDRVQIGENVIAIGNPLGLQFSVSRGIISAKNRPGPNNIRAYIQTDAALNPGNSGGPLINSQGKTVGINNFKIGGSENIGFALESNYIKEISNQISLENLNQTILS